MPRRTAGIPSFVNKLKAIAISGVFAGCAGALYALVLLVVTPVSVFGMLVSAQALIIPMFGGRGTAWGAAIGAAILVPMSEMLHAHFGALLPGIAGVVFGLAIILVVLLIPNGIYWAFADWIRKHVSGANAHGDAATSTQIARFREAAAERHLGHHRKSKPPDASPVPTGSDILVVSEHQRAFGGVKALQNVSFASGLARSWASSDRMVPARRPCSTYCRDWFSPIVVRPLCGPPTH